VIQLYTWGTPNGKKVSIMLEEIGMPYEVFPINIGQRDQFKPEYLEINPNNKIPSIIDTDGPGGKPFTIFESGAILMYLAEKSGKLWPADIRQRYTVIQWLMFQMGGIGPMFGQANYFYRQEEKNSGAIERFRKEALRLYGVLDKELARRDYLAGEYSIADIATYTWVGRHDGHHVQLEEFPNVKRWFDAISKRAAVQRGMEIPKK
jgi:GSH-dependent disulfide-bond oxidoreductase